MIPVASRVCTAMVTPGRRTPRSYGASIATCSLAE
jgi:hypothetical protein